METDLEPLWEYENQMLANGQELRDTDCSIVVVLQIHPYGQTWDSRKITIPIPSSQIGPFREMKSAHLQFFITMKDDSYFIYLQSDAGYKYFHSTQQGRKAKRIERKMIALQWRYYNAKNGLLGKMW